MTTLTEVATVFVPVSDIDRSLAFYVDALGFEQRADFAYGSHGRWVEVAPAGARNAIALVGTHEGSATSAVTHCALATTDIAAAHAAMLAAGVETDGDGTHRSGLRDRDVRFDAPVPPQFTITDPDGNRLLIVGSGA